MSDAENEEKVITVRFGVVFAERETAEKSGYFIVMSSAELIAVHVKPFDALPPKDELIRLSDEAIWVAIFRDEPQIFLLQSNQRYRYKDDVPDSHAHAASFAITIGASVWSGWAKTVGIKVPKEPLIPYPLHAVGVA